MLWQRVPPSTITKQCFGLLIYYNFLAHAMNCPPFGYGAPLGKSAEIGRNPQVCFRGNDFCKKKKKITIFFFYVAAWGSHINAHLTFCSVVKSLSSPGRFPMHTNGHPYKRAGNGRYRIYIQGEAVSDCRSPSESKPLGCERFATRARRQGMKRLWQLAQSLPKPRGRSVTGEHKRVSSRQ